MPCRPGRTRSGARCGWSRCVRRACARSGPRRARASRPDGPGGTAMCPCENGAAAAQDRVGEALAADPGSRESRALRPQRAARSAHIRDASGRPSRAAERREEVIAGALAPAALLGGQTAVLMVMRVTLALRGTGATRGQACPERRELRVGVRVGLAAEDAPGVNARVGAIEAEPHAASQRGDIGLGEARVGADRARRGARGALVDARRERGDVGDEWTPMRSEDLFDAHLLSFGWMRFSRRLRPQKPVRRPRARAATWSNKRFRESWRGSLTRS